MQGKLLGKLTSGLDGEFLLAGSGIELSKCAICAAPLRIFFNFNVQEVDGIPSIFGVGDRL
jgi:hypothetical protein